MIAIVDYGMGNLHSVAKALDHVGASARITDDPKVIERADKVVLPGVGAMPAAMEELAKRRLIRPVCEAIARGVPYLGICLGLQLLFQDGEEGKGSRGLGILRGTVRKFPARVRGRALKIPHMGWNQLEMQKAKGKRQNDCPLLKGIPEDAYFYFVHSYYADPLDRFCVTGETTYGVQFASMVWARNVFATQFHPEKSQTVGLRLLKNFVNL